MTMRAARWAIVVVGGLLVILAIVAGAGSRTATLRQLVVETLADRLNSDVELESFSVGIPGATVQIAGSYGLQTEALEFDGMLRMQATISEAAGGGLKSFFLKAVDPFFRKPGAGTVLPIRIRGHRSQPKFGLDVAKALTPR